MARKSEYDIVFKNRTLKDLEALEKSITIALNHFIQCENEAGIITYRKFKSQVDQAIAEMKDPKDQ